ncbi:MAG: hypothetical protein WD873_04075 [Candidatus Hydrogenedentales bacterium]
MMTAILVSALFAAGTREAMFAAGVDAYYERDYAAAIEAFERVAAEGAASPALFHNLGNAYFRVGLPGPAIANYHRALQLDPSMENAQENLARAVQATRRGLAPPPPPVWEQALFFWHNNLGFATVFWLGAASWIVGWLLLAFRLMRPWPYLRMAASVCLAVSVACLASAWIKAHPRPLAVTVADVAKVHYGTNEAEPVRFELYAGDRVIADARRPGWLRVVTAEGERGWTQADNLTLVGPPYE